mmetsp:Transcript_37514/g.74451  ORF Transcript_37514/g.74451 Transcript_37514/m.74451 type:complete len:469 (-) Transcript_37514:22-1428(-)
MPAEWDDPSSEASDEGGCEDDVKAKEDEELRALGFASQGTSARGERKPDNNNNGLWDPLEGLRPRKKSRTGKGAGVVHAGVASTEISEGVTACLVGLQKAAHLNGQVGTVAGPVDGATGRCFVLLKDGTVKSLRQDNLRVVLTGAIVRVKDLQSATELNGKLADCGGFDAATGRYDVMISDGDPPKRIKEENLELVRRFVTPQQMLSSQRRPFAWADAIDRIRGLGWTAQLNLLEELGLPLPRLIPAEAFAKVLLQGTWAEAYKTLSSHTVSARQVPTRSDGHLGVRLLAASPARDSCCCSASGKGAGIEELKKLGTFVKEAFVGGNNETVHLLLPGCCVRNFTGLQAAASCGWPLYLQLCQGLVCVESELAMAKTWCRFDKLFVGTVLIKPVYLLPNDGAASARLRTPRQESGQKGWLLSDACENTQVGALADGQVLPGERQFLERLASDVLPERWRTACQFSWYRL